MTSAERIRGITCPVLVLAGDADRIVPPEQSRRLYEAVPGPKDLVVFTGVGHNDLEFLTGKRMMGEVTTFLDGVLGEPAG